MKIIYTDQHEQHNPPYEFLSGKITEYFESPRRAEIILSAVQDAALGEVIAPRDFGSEPILAVHTPAYVEHLRTIHARWSEDDTRPPVAMPEAFPRQGYEGETESVIGLLGRYAFDMSAGITAGTYEAAVAAAQCALTGAALLRENVPVAYALCRPPGHHAYADLMGGYCYLNNAAIAAQELAGWGKVTLLDIDYHHGNGTQAIFYDRADVQFISIHASPDIDYPYFAGFASEIGSGAGEGFNLNYPLGAGTDDAAYLATLDDALRKIRLFEPSYLIISAGFDTFGGDPLGKFRLTSPVYTDIGARIMALGLPTLVVQEGGYAMAELGTNAVNFLRGLV